MLTVLRLACACMLLQPLRQLGLQSRTPLHAAFNIFTGLLQRPLR